MLPPLTTHGLPRTCDTTHSTVYALPARVAVAAHTCRANASCRRRPPPALRPERAALRPCAGPRCRDSQPAPQECRGNNLSGWHSETGAVRVSDHPVCHAGSSTRQEGAKRVGPADSSTTKPQSSTTCGQGDLPLQRGMLVLRLPTTPGGSSARCTAAALLGAAAAHLALLAAALLDAAAAHLALLATALLDAAAAGLAALHATAASADLLSLDRHRCRQGSRSNSGSSRSRGSSRQGKHTDRGIMCGNKELMSGRSSCDLLWARRFAQCRPSVRRSARTFHHSATSSP